MTYKSIFQMTIPSILVTSRQIIPSQRNSAYLITPLSHSKQVDTTIFEICLLYITYKQQVYTLGCILF